MTETETETAAPAPPVIAPPVGLTVQYTMDNGTAQSILANRNFAGTRGNSVSAGDKVAAVVVRTFSPHTTTANLRLILDGYDGAVWVTSVAQGNSPFNWNYIPAVAA
jgi:hypothetical protein